MTYVLVADIGGTNARFARIDAKGVHDEALLAVADYDGPARAARAYMAGLSGKYPAPKRAVFAVAGPVTGDDMFALTNHDWAFSISATREALGLDSLELINDFHAMALGVPTADPANVHKLDDATPVSGGNMAIIGPGTGLGVATLVRDTRGGPYVAVPCEGAHQTVPVRTNREWDLISWMLANKYSHVSAERVCSGHGLVNLYESICALDGRIAEVLDAPTITKRALARSCPSCVEALDLMLAFLGRMAGNLALVSNARGGVYLCGGILPRLGLEALLRSRLRSEFIAKGRMSAYIETMPIFMVDDGFLPLGGLRAYARGN